MAALFRNVAVVASTTSGAVLLRAENQNKDALAERRPWWDDFARSKSQSPPRGATAASAMPATKGWRLVQVQINSRHGDRSPRQQLPKIAAVWPASLAQLTPLGMRQSYELGDAIDEYYGQLWNHRFEPENVKCRASSRDRSIASATCVAAGLFPLGTGPTRALPLAQQPVPISSTDYWNDILFHACDRCPGLEQKRAEFYATETFKAKERAAQPVFRKLEALTGLKPTLERFYPMFDSLSCLKTHGIFDLEAYDAKLWKEALDIAHWSETKRFHSSIGGNYGGGLAGGPMVQAIDYQIELAVRGDPRAKKFILYNGHDSTMLSLLAALRLDELHPHAFSRIPGQASAIAIELWKKDDRHLTTEEAEAAVTTTTDGGAAASAAERSRFAVRVVYRRGVVEGGRTLDPDTPWMPYSLSPMGGDLATHEQWRRVVQRAVPEDWCAACENTTSNACAQRSMRLQKLLATKEWSKYDKLAALEDRIRILEKGGDATLFGHTLVQYKQERERVLEQMGCAEDENLAYHNFKCESDARKLQINDIIPTP